MPAGRALKVTVSEGTKIGTELETGSSGSVIDLEVSEGGKKANFKFLLDVPGEISYSKWNSVQHLSLETVRSIDAVLLTSDGQDSVAGLPWVCEVNPTVQIIATEPVRRIGKLLLDAWAAHFEAPLAHISLESTLSPDNVKMLSPKTAVSRVARATDSATKSLDEDKKAESASTKLGSAFPPHSSVSRDHISRIFRDIRSLAYGEFFTLKKPWVADDFDTTSCEDASATLELIALPAGTCLGGAMWSISCFPHDHSIGSEAILLGRRIRYDPAAQWFWRTVPANLKKRPLVAVLSSPWEGRRSPTFDEIPEFGAIMASHRTSAHNEVDGVSSLENKNPCNGWGHGQNVSIQYSAERGVKLYARGSGLDDVAFCNALVATALRTIKHGGDVLIPVDAGSTLLQVISIFERAWSPLLREYPVYMVDVNHNLLVSQAATMTEWMTQAARDQFISTGRALFAQTKRVCCSSSVDQVLADSRSKVIISTPGDIGAGFSQEIFSKICMHEKSLVILVTKPSASSLQYAIFGSGGSFARLSSPLQRTLRIRKLLRETLPVHELRAVYLKTLRQRELEQIAGSQDLVTTSLAAPSGLEPEEAADLAKSITGSSRESIAGEINFDDHLCNIMEAHERLWTNVLSEPSKDVLDLPDEYGSVRKEVIPLTTNVAQVVNDFESGNMQLTLVDVSPKAPQETVETVTSPIADGHSENTLPEWRKTLRTWFNGIEPFREVEKEQVIPLACSAMHLAIPRVSIMRSVVDFEDSFGKWVSGVSLLQPLRLVVACNVEMDPFAKLFLAEQLSQVGTTLVSERGENNSITCCVTWQERKVFLDGLLATAISGKNIVVPISRGGHRETYSDHVHLKASGGTVSLARVFASVTKSAASIGIRSRHINDPNTRGSSFQPQETPPMKWEKNIEGVHTMLVSDSWHVPIVTSGTSLSLKSFLAEETEKAANRPTSHDAYTHLYHFSGLQYGNKAELHHNRSIKPQKSRFVHWPLSAISQVYAGIYRDCGGFPVSGAQKYNFNVKSFKGGSFTAIQQAHTFLKGCTNEDDICRTFPANKNAQKVSLSSELRTHQIQLPLILLPHCINRNFMVKVLSQIFVAAKVSSGHYLDVCERDALHSILTDKTAVECITERNRGAVITVSSQIGDAALFALQRIFRSHLTLLRSENIV